MGPWASPEWANFAIEVWQLLSPNLTRAVSRSCGNRTRGEIRPLSLRLQLVFTWLSTRLCSLQWSRQLPRAADCWDDKSACLCCLIHPCELIQETQLCAAAGVAKEGVLAGVRRQPLLRIAITSWVAAFTAFISSIQFYLRGSAAQFFLFDHSLCAYCGLKICLLIFGKEKITFGCTAGNLESALYSDLLIITAKIFILTIHYRVRLLSCLVNILSLAMINNWCFGKIQKVFSVFNYILAQCSALGETNSTSSHRQDVSMHLCTSSSDGSPALPY